MALNNIEILKGKLDQFILKFYKNELIKGAIFSLMILSIVAVFFIFIEYLFRFDTLTRSVLFYSWLTLFTFLLATKILVPVLKMMKVTSGLDYTSAAKIIGEHFQEVKDKLLNTLQLEETNDSNSDLLIASINQKVAEIQPVTFTTAINFKENLKSLRFLFIVLGTIILGSIVLPEVFLESTSRLVQHNNDFTPPPPHTFKILNDELMVGQNDDFNLKVKVEGDALAERVYLETNDNKFLLRKIGKQEFEYQFKRVNQSVVFKLSSEIAKSGEFELNALPKPNLIGMEAQLNYPKYTQKPNEVVENNGDLVVPEGTKIEWKLSADKTDKINVNFGEKSLDIIPDQVHRNFQFSEVVKNDLSYTISTANKHFQFVDSIEYNIHVIKDLYPEIAIEQESDSISFSQLFFKGNIEDDYGFSDLKFKFKQKESESYQSESIKVVKDINRQTIYHFVNLDKLDLKPGDDFEYFFEVWDNDGVNGSKSAKTGVYTYEIPDKNELDEIVDNKRSKVEQKLKNNITQAKDLQKEYDEIRKELMDKEKLSWSDKQRINDFLQKQTDLSNNIEKIKQQNEQLNEQQKSVSQMDEKLLEKQKNLEDLMDKLLPEEMKQQMDKLKKLLEEMNKDKAEDMLEKINMNNKEMEKELDRTLEIFKQMEFEQKLEESIKNLKELSKEQEKLSEETKKEEKSNKELEKKQDELNKKFDDIKKDLEELKKKNEELENKREFKTDEEKKNEIDKEMKDSKEMLNKGKNKKASEKQKNASEQMQEMAQQMSEMQMQQEEQQNQEDMDAMRQLLENLLYLSFEEEKLLDELRNMYRLDPKYVDLTKKQNRLKSEAKIIEDSLFALSKRQVQLQSFINKEMSEINNNLQKSIAHMAERRTHEAVEFQQNVMTSANKLALILDESLQQMQQQAAKKKMGKKACNKPGNGPPSMNSLKQMQEQLSKQLQDMKDGQQSGGKSGNDGNKNAGKSKKLAKLAAQQAAIREHLKNIGQELNKDGKGGIGGMEGLQEMMDKNEADIVKDQISAETIRRQKEILTRLLEAEKAVREREYEDKRESNEGKDQNNGTQDNFIKYKWLKKKESELLKSVPPSLNLFYKKKVNDYFNTFED